MATTRKQFFCISDRFDARSWLLSREEEQEEVKKSKEPVRAVNHHCTNKLLCCASASCTETTNTQKRVRQLMYNIATIK